MKNPTSVLKEKWHTAETIDDKGNYEKKKYRTVEQIGFYIRPLREWFFPCQKCQQDLKKQMSEGRWIFGNKDYEPLIELNNTKNELDEDSFETVEGPRKATKEELKRLGLEGWEEIE